MTLPSSGPLSLSDIQGEFGGSNPIGMNEYYAGGGLVPSGTTGTYGAVPTSGQISVQNFYGTSNYVPIYIEDVFATYVYKGIYNTPVTVNTGVNLSTYGGLLWIKDRSSPISHQLWDSARTPYYKLASNTDEAQNYNATYNVAFSTTGFTDNNLWDSSENIVSWSFRKQPKFFDVVTYTGNSVAGRTVSHNLGSTPGFIIVKKYNASGNWACYHQSLGATQGFYLNSIGGSYSTSAMWNNTAPTSSVFTVGDDFDVNLNGYTYVAYLFASNAGGFGLTGSDNVISCGSFTTASGSPTATINLGYEPQWLLLKSTGSGNWFVMDNMRGWSNFSATASNAYALRPNSNGVETDYGICNPTSTGFQLLSNSGQLNNETFIYIAIRRGPMKVPTVGTTVFSPNAVNVPMGTQITTGFPVDTTFPVYRSGQGPRVEDRLRGISTSTTDSTTEYYLSTPSTAAESNSLGFTYGWNNTGFLMNGGYANAPDVFWSFRRAPGFFDVVCYKGTSTAGATQAHNLGVVPEMIIVKVRSTSNYWTVYTATTGNSKDLFLNTTDAAVNDDAWNYTTPTASVFTLGAGSLVNGNQTYVAYLFATCAGVSKVGTYTGTGALQTVNCSFTTGARFVMIKRTDSSGDWYVWDSARGISSGTDPYLLMNSTAAEVTGTNYVDTTSVGFQVTAAAPSDLNASGGTYIFLAIA